MFYNELVVELVQLLHDYYDIVRKMPLVLIGDTAVVSNIGREYVWMQRHYWNCVAFLDNNAIKIYNRLTNTTAFISDQSLVQMHSDKINTDPIINKNFIDALRNYLESAKLSGTY